MAKFYQRYVVPRTEETVLYGYSGDNLIINGQFYIASTGLQQVGNFQCHPALGECGCLISPIHATSIFEPGFYANAFDLAGGRFLQEHETNTYRSIGTYKNPFNNRWTFKNHIQAVSPTTWCTTASNIENESLRGCVLSGSACTTFVCAAQPSACVVGCATCVNSIAIKTQCDTYVCFNPMTAPLMHACSCTSCVGNSCTHVEQTFGDSTTSYRSCCSFFNCSVNFRYGPISTFTAPFIPTAANTCPYLNGHSDTNIFGSCCSLCNACGLPAGFERRVYILGAYPVFDSPIGAIENGVRVHLVSNETYVFYLYFNAQVGGIQGVDTSTSAVERMQVRVLNNDTAATTTLATWKKGVGGLVIPSNPDLSNETNYRFYMMTFNGADTATQTISILRPNINLSNGTMTAGDAYTLSSMTTAQQAAIYAALGYNNTGNGVFNDANLRRQTTNRIWLSTDGDGNKRLHLGIYNTNGTGLVTNANSFNDPDQRGSMFKIWSWGLNDGTTTATFLGSVDLSTYAPRYFCPLNDDWTVVYAGASLTNDIVLTLNGTTGLYQYQNTMPYSASRLFKDADGRWAVQVEDPGAGNGTVSGNYIDIITSSVGQTLVITATTTSYIYSGTTINGNITVNVYNYLGERVAKTVNLTVVGPTASPGITFANDEYTTTVTTSASVDTTVAIKVISSASAKIIGTVSES